MSWEKEEAKSRHVDFQCVRSRSVNSLIDANDGKIEEFKKERENVCFFVCLDLSSGNALLFPFLEAAQNQIIPPPPSPRELFPALVPLSSSGLPGDTSYTD